MEKKSKDQGHLIVANGGGVQHTGSGDSMDGIHCRFHAAGIKSATVRSLCKLERREDKGEGRGFAQRGRHAGNRVPKKRKKEGGGPVRGQGRGIESRQEGKRTVHEDA